MPFKVIHYPASSDNPYLKLLLNSLRINNVECELIENNLFVLIRSLLLTSDRFYHIHWIHGIVVRRSFVITGIKFFIFHFSLLISRYLLQKKIYFTLHNLKNHENKRLLLDKINTWLMLSVSHKVIVHGTSAISLIRKEFPFIPLRKFVYVPHGNYFSEFDDFDVPNVGIAKFVNFTFVGMIRPYKGVVDLIQSFKPFSKVSTLTIAGQPSTQDLYNKICSEAADVQNINLILDYLSDKRFFEICMKSSVLVFPFKEIFCSGSIVYAMSVGKPIIAPRYGLICDYLDDSCAFLYDINDPNGLSSAMISALRCPKLMEMGHLALNKAKGLSWPLIGKKLQEIYAYPD